MNNKLDPESLEFITFAMEYLENDEVRQEFFLACKRKFQNFISRDPEDIKNRLKAKLTIGGREHGPPGKYSLTQLDEELELEFLDILGWSLVQLWCEKKLK